MTQGTRHKGEWVVLFALSEDTANLKFGVKQSMQQRGAEQGVMRMARLWPTASSSVRDQHLFARAKGAILFLTNSTPVSDPR